MSRKSEGNYTDVARQVLSELGGGPIRSKDLVAAARERGLVGDGKWVYHNLLRMVREDEEFDTSKRGYVSLPGHGAWAADQSGSTTGSDENPEAPMEDSGAFASDPEDNSNIPGTDPLLNTV